MLHSPLLLFPTLKQSYLLTLISASYSHPSSAAFRTTPTFWCTSPGSRSKQLHAHLFRRSRSRILGVTTRDLRRLAKNLASWLRSWCQNQGWRTTVTNHRGRRVICRGKSRPTITKSVSSRYHGIYRPRPESFDRHRPNVRSAFSVHSLNELGWNICNSGYTLECGRRKKLWNTNLCRQ